MVSVELWKDLSDVVHYELRQFPIVIFNYEAEELSIAIINNVAYFLFEWERRKPLPLKLCVILTNVKHIHIVVYFKGFIHFERLMFQSFIH